MSFDPTSFRTLATSDWGRQKPFVPKAAAVNLALIGVTRDSAGAALGNCTVELYHGKVMIAGTTSNASGNYRFDNPGSGPFRVVFDKTGLAGLTSETLIAV